MAELSLAISYKPVSKNAVVAVNWLWGLLGIACLVALWLNWHHLPWWILASAFFGGGFIYVYVPFRLVTAQLEGSQLIGDRNGLVLPPSHFGFGSDRSIMWKEIASVDYAEQTANLRLRLKDKSQIVIRARSIGIDDLYTLMLALEIWAVNAVWTGRASAFRDAMQTSKLGLAANSFTQVWELELKNKFSSTTFVPLAPGSLLRNGTIEVLRQLAFGGFSAVYLARDHAGEEVVVKECSVQIEGDDPVARKTLEFFQREANVLKKLHHAQIARVLDHFLENGRSYLVLEYIHGTNLRDLVRRNGPMKEAQVGDLLRQMQDMLSYLHGQAPPVVHRDFSPDNLLLTEDGRLILVDFGAAMEFATRATGTLVGKQFYMAPEQLRGKAEPASDLYGMGSTLYFLLIGKDPPALSILHPKQANPAISDQLDNLVARLTAQEPHNRGSLPVTA